MFHQPYILHIYSSRAPYQLTILTCNNQVLQKITVLSQCTKICLCTNDRHVKLIAQAGNQTLFRVINLCCNFFHHLWVDLYFPQSQVFITLNDANYGLPIANATLNFQGVN